jgi:hypothetical protein
MVQTRRGLTDPANSQTLDPASQNLGKTRVPPTVNPGQPANVGNGETVPIDEIAPGVQETGNNSSAPNQSTHNTTVPPGTNSQTTIRDAPELQNLRDALRLMQGHNNTVHHEQDELRTAVNLAFDEQRRMFAEWRDREIEALRAHHAEIENLSRQATVMIRKSLPNCRSATAERDSPG